MCTFHLILDVGFMFIKIWKMPALLTSLSLLFSEPSWHHCTPISWTCVWRDSRLSCPCRSPPGGGPQKWFLNRVPHCSPGSRARRVVVDWSSSLPATPVHLKPGSEYIEFSIRYVWKQGVAAYGFFFFLKLFWKPSVNQKCWALPLLLPYQCVRETLLLLSLSSFSLLVCNMMALAQMP